MPEPPPYPQANHLQSQLHYIPSPSSPSISPSPLQFQPANPQNFTFEQQFLPQSGFGIALQGSSSYGTHFATESNTASSQHEYDSRYIGNDDHNFTHNLQPQPSSSTEFQQQNQDFAAIDGTMLAPGSYLQVNQLQLQPHNIHSSSPSSISQSPVPFQAAKQQNFTFEQQYLPQSDLGMDYSRTGTLQDSSCYGGHFDTATGTEHDNHNFTQNLQSQPTSSTDLLQQNQVFTAVDETTPPLPHPHFNQLQLQQYNIALSSSSSVSQSTLQFKSASQYFLTRVPQNVAQPNVGMENPGTGALQGTSSIVGNFDTATTTGHDDHNITQNMQPQPASLTEFQHRNQVFGMGMQQQTESRESPVIKLGKNIAGEKPRAQLESQGVIDDHNFSNPHFPARVEHDHEKQSNNFEAIRSQQQSGEKKCSSSVNDTSMTTPISTARFVCDDCGRTYKRLNILKEHKYLYHNENYDPVSKICGLCGEKFTSPREWSKHFNKNHAMLKTQTELINCNFCGKGVKSVENLKVHCIFYHSDGLKEQNFITCHICHYKNVFSGEESFIDHMRRVHPEHGVGSHDCFRCEIKFSCRKKLKDHVKTTHPDSYFLCEECDDFRFSRLGLMAHYRDTCPCKHVKRSNQFVREIDRLVLTCELCGQQVLLRELRRHYKGVHDASEELYKCPQCQKEFKTREYWVTHLEERHQVPFSQVEDLVRSLHFSGERDKMRVKPSIFPKEEPRKLPGEPGDGEGRRSSGGEKRKRICADDVDDESEREGGDNEATDILGKDGNDGGKESSGRENKREKKCEDSAVDEGGEEPDEG